MSSSEIAPRVGFPDEKQVAEAGYAANCHRWQLRVKHTLDRVLALFLLMLLLPVLLAVAAAILVSLGRPILFRQMRVGQFGRPFAMFKFRTMAGDTEFVPAGREINIEFAPGGVEGMDRRSTVGRWLRSSSLDELAQLWNVLKGEMSLVGPRPERPEFAALFEREIEGYRNRHRFRVGMTGLAQVSGLCGATSLKARTVCDNAYIDNYSLLLDLLILLRTPRAIAHRVWEGE
jgi:lipopolysaccharide/colanic/teichoic acid biosynthesis glycosyltransferase